MIFRLMLFYMKVDGRNYFQTKLAFLGLSIGIFLNLVIYWYTSKFIGQSFSSSLENYGMSYFDYLLIGDIILQSAMSMIEVNTNHFFMLKVNKGHDYLRTTTAGLEKIFLAKSLAIFPRDIAMMILYFAIGKAFFTFNLSMIDFLLGIFLQLIFLPSFIGISFIILSFFSVFGRGMGIIGYFNTIASIVAGGFFPVEVLPMNVDKFAMYLTPYNTLLYGFRRFMASRSLELLGEVFILGMFWSIILYGGGIICYKLFQRIELRYGIKYIFER